MGAAEESDRIGAYRVVQRLATSDTSEVLLAKAEGPMGFERTVVLKVLLEHLTSDEGSAGAFAREAAAYARLADPAIVTLYEFSEHRGRLVMALEHVDGASLADVVAVLAESGETLDDKTALYVAQRVFAALATAHRAPIVHRDVNPSNVLVSWDGEVKLTDFGFARFMGATHQSAFGMIKGTFGYMAPEQIEDGAITSRTDIYAAGLLLWELLTHQTAFARGRISEVEALTTMAEPKLGSLDELRPDLPQRLRSAVTRALRPRSEDRDISASEMVSILRGLVPSDIGREKLATWLERLRPHLARGASDARNDADDDPEDQTVSVTDGPHAVRRPDLGRPRSFPSGQTAVSPQVTAQLAAESRYVPTGALATPPSAPLEESTRVMLAPQAQPQPRPAPQPEVDSAELAPNTSPMADRPPIPAVPAPVPVAAPSAPAWTPNPGAPVDAGWHAPPPVGGTWTVPPAKAHAPAPVRASSDTPPSRGGVGLALVLIGGVGLSIVVAAAASGVLLADSPAAAPVPSAKPKAASGSSSSSSAANVSAAPAPIPPPPSAAPVESGAPPAPPPSSAPSPPSPSSPAPARSGAGADVTVVRTEGSSPGRRIFVDGRAVGQTPASVTVPCGAHDLRIGSSGVAKRMELPCGGEITLVDR